MRSAPRTRRVPITAAVLVLVLALAAGIVALISTKGGAPDTGYASPAKDSLLSLGDPADKDNSAATDSGITSVQLPPPSQTAAEPPVDTVTLPVERKSVATPKVAPPTGNPAQPKPGRAPVQVPPVPEQVPSVRKGGDLLRPYEFILHPGLQRDSALQALSALDALLPRLSTAHDSVEADIYRAEATALAGEPEQACAILERARPRAGERQRQRIELWVDQGICTAQQSSVFPRRSKNVSAESLRRSFTISKG